VVQRLPWVRSQHQKRKDKKRKKPLPKWEMKQGTSLVTGNVLHLDWKGSYMTCLFIYQTTPKQLHFLEYKSYQNKVDLKIKVNSNRPVEH
jgi:hypothetical protein